MPSRMIKEGIRTSKQIGSIDDFSFRLWAYLLTYVDDYGRGSADPELLKGFLFARRASTTLKNIQDGLDKLAFAGLVKIYVVDGEPFLFFPTWSKHQRIQTKQSKFPAPEEGIELTKYSTVTHGDSRKSTVTHGDSPLETKPNRNQVEVEEEAEVPRAAQFEAFWDAYPRHAGKEKARQAFEKVNVDIQILLDAIAKQKKSDQWTKDGGTFVPYPATWLNQKRWEDELPQAAAGNQRGTVYGSGEVGEAEMEAIRRVMQQDLEPLPWQESEF